MSPINELYASDEELRSRFAISPLIDIEIDVGGAGWVGLAADASHELRRDVTAAVLAERAGYTSLDYVRKRYLKDMEERESRDAELRELWRSHEIAYDRFYRSFNPPRDDAPLGIFAFDLTMVRARTAVRLMIVTARQGFLLESCVIARSILEQLAYCAYVFEKVDHDEVFDVRPQSLIKRLTAPCPSSGRAYGLLSQLSHYDPKIHYHFIGDGRGATITQRSWQFKIIASAWAFYIINLKFLVFKSVYSSYNNFGLVKEIENTTSYAFDRHFNRVDNAFVREVRDLMS